MIEMLIVTHSSHSKEIIPHNLILNNNIRTLNIVQYGSSEHPKIIRMYFSLIFSLIDNSVLSAYQ
uniref:Putative ovule protein n=1 Tax=Solanum chacoense TaxID=4108 RepID=A0A0V0GYW3_SOLCH